MKVLGMVLFWAHIAWHILLAWLIGEAVLNHKIELIIVVGLLITYLILKYRKSTNDVSKMMLELKEELKENTKK